MTSDVKKMAIFSSEDALPSALNLFPRSDFLKDKQKVCIEALSEKKVVLGLLPTGFGKSLMCQFFPKIHLLVIGSEIICAITEEHTAVFEFKELRIAAAAIVERQKIDGEGKYEEIRGRVCDIESRLISRHPLLLETFFRANKLNRFVIGSSQSMSIISGGGEHKQWCAYGRRFFAHRFALFLALNSRTRSFIALSR